MFRRNVLQFPCWFASAAALLVAGLTAQAVADAVDFTRDVRPILSQHCFKCHGPDEAARQSGLRLDVREAAVAPAASGDAAILPGRPDASELVRRIESSDEFERMPPPSAKNPLSAEQKDVLRRWIAQGADYQPHWAFVPPERPELPSVRRGDWPRNLIDVFVLARLEAAGLEPSPRADPHTLVRRLYLDLIGLPPTPEEADAFVNDPSPDAYDELVDRLLASPHYGERWARRWLDLARYADTNGYEKDRPRSIWPYRDWVIRALNDDLPFDQFTVEQIAGDLLPEATLDQRIATGFHRNTMLNEEGGIDPLEFRYHAMADRVATTGTVWLGLTLGCAQCHTHKYDPVTHREYFQFMAFLNNTEEPEIDLPSAEVDARRAELRAQIAALEADLENHFPGDLDARFAEWLATERARSVPWTPLEPIAAESNLPLLTIQPDGSVFSSGDQTKRDTYRVTYRPVRGTITALRLDVLPDERLPAHGPGRTYYEGPKGDFFLSEFRVTADGQPLAFRGASESYGKLGIGSAEASAQLAIDGDPHTGWSTSGREGEPHHAVFLLHEPISVDGEIELEMLFERHYSAGLGRFRLSASRPVPEDGTADDPAAALRPVDDPAARDLPAEIERLLLRPPEELSEADQARLRRHYLTIAPELKERHKKIEDLRRQMPAYPTTLVMAERPPENPRPTRMYHRGEFLQPGEPVDPAVLSVLHPLEPSSVPDRLAFARWLVDPRNPLVGRVTVNRHWAAFFGRGLVPTLDDFGFQGDPPTHPDLLDWLAVGFTGSRDEEARSRSGRHLPAWSVKGLHRLIVTSATYRQSSHVSRALLERDPDNRLLARGPRFRLEGELIRDAALRISGLLSPKLGGPGVFPPQPPSITTEGAFGRLEWKVSEGEDRYRRGLYTFAKRTAPYATFTTFDAPSGEACVARREVSNTPLQALTLLNDPVFLEAAQALGRRIASADGGVEDRAAELFRRCLTRPPTPGERDEIVAFYRLQRERLESGDLDPAPLAGEGGADPVERAAWTVVARVLLNLDETITKD